MKQKIIILIVAAIVIGGVLLALQSGRSIRILPNPEIDMIDYSWIKHSVIPCYPNAKGEVKEALANDDKILEDEYRKLVHNCSRAIDMRNSAAKQNLIESLK